MRREGVTLRGRPLPFAAALAVAMVGGAAPTTAAAQQLVTMDVDLPRVMVFIQEEGETVAGMFSAFLQEAGFTVIDPAFARDAVQRDLANAALAGDDGAATELGRDMGAQVLVLGSVPSEDRPSPAEPSLRVATAHLTVRALRLDEARVVSVHQADARGLDATGLGARQKAIRQAAEETLYRSPFVGDLLIDWDESSWEDAEYWDPGPGSVGAQMQVPAPGSGAAAPVGTLSIAILESDTYPAGKTEGTRSIEIVGVQPRRARIRGLVSAPAARVRVGSVDAEVRELGADEAIRLGLPGSGAEFRADVPLGPDDRRVRVQATAGSDEAEVEVTPEVGRRWAVIIGISEYADARITPLRYADDDASAVYDFLRSPEGGSVPESNIRLLLNEDATAAAVREALFVFLQQAAAEDFVTVYVASHGSPDPKRTANLYVLPYDTDVDAMASTAFPMWDVKTALRRQIAAERVVVIADACRSAGTLVDEPNPVAGAFSELFSPSRRLTISAAGLNEVSFEDAKWGGGHGVFTHFLLRGLQGAADTDGDGVVTFREAAAYVQDRVPAQTDGEQTPQWSGLGDVPMAMVPTGDER